MPDGIDEADLRYQYRILDMRQIDCDALLQQDTPDALVLAILCDFKNRPAKGVVHHIVTRLKMLLKDDESGFRRYIDMLEILSENRELQETIKEVEKMLTQVNIKNLPSYPLGLEQGKLEIARNLLPKMSDDEIAETTGLSLQEIQKLRKEESRKS